MNSFNLSLNLNDLTLDNIGQWPKAAKYAVLIIAAMLVLGLGYWLIISSKIDQYQLLEEQEVPLKAEFEMKQQQAANLQAYKNQLSIMNERFGNMLKQLPAENEMPGLLEDISKTGIASGLTFDLFAPQPEITHDFYIELPINIKVVGSYNQLAVFLSRVAQMNRIVTLHDFDVKTMPADTQKLNSGEMLEMEITAKIYRYRTQ